MRLSDEQLRLLGQIAVTFGSIEGTTEFACALLIGPDIETGFLAGAGDPLTAQLHRLERLAGYRLPAPLAAEVNEWIKYMTRAARLRNSLLHGAAVATGEGDFEKFRRSRTGQVRRWTYSEDRLAEISRIFGLLREHGLRMVERIETSSKWTQMGLEHPGRDRPRWITED